MQGLVEKIADLPLFRSVKPGHLSSIADDLVWFCLPGGKTLFTQGEIDNSLYIVLSGRLGAFVRNEDGEEVLVRRMAAGETVGELALLSNQPRSATVLALRDTELIKLSKNAFDRLIDDNPRSVYAVTDLLVRRMREGPQSGVGLSSPRTLTVIPASRDLPATDFVRTLAASLAALGLETMIVDRASATRPIDWFNRVEADHDVVIYEADADLTLWTRLALRQADRVALLVDAASPPPAPPAFRAALDNPRKAQIELVLFRRVTADPAPHTLALVAAFPTAQHHHFAADEPRDHRHIARMIAGRAVGLVLSGGGARAFAQIGVIRAMRESGIEIDLYGGTSMGAIVAACAAIGWDYEQMMTSVRHGFANSRAMKDYTLPLISLIRGARAATLFEYFFGDTRIEECRYPFYCVSANLTSGRQKIHRTGPLGLALRASSAIAGVLPPIIDETFDILTDGGMLNNLPIDVMLDMRRGPVVAVDVTSNYALKSTVGDIHRQPLWSLVKHARHGTPNIFRLLVAAGSVSSYAQTKLMRNEVALMVEPPLEEIGMLDWGAIDRTVEIGYRHTLEMLKTATPRLWS